ncbi:A-factor type gamma-butyrolactone 1'-reductase (1S-forming)-like [Leguminivora glycinivorella]|uniref:A-factor type gamma-butyrolactone 1'-reductase (1S-forming)-like n=1 Tax=Leguminivora glycinivorella TaxID=1035111 RepID=UPI002010B106|nr:A-factor type gamma-butyrolactone 1'-reductase (1S-forming)-like [Leguminivora glycinivorella]
MSFSGKVVLVTGASSGIGAAAAILFTKEGAKVAIVGRNETKLGNVAKQCGEKGEQPLVIKADIFNEEEASNIVQKTVDKFGRLDVLINNAGFSKLGSILDGKILEAYDAVMKTNMRAAIQLTTLAAPHLIKTKGNIINTSSTGSLHVPQSPTHAAYCISKAALDHFTRCAALELASSGVRVNSVNPGPVKTDILENSNVPNPDAVWEHFRRSTALNKIAEPEEIAELMLFLASDKARSITGSIYVADNGFLLKN